MELFIETINGSEIIERKILLRKDDTLSKNGRVYWKTIFENNEDDNFKINFTEYPTGLIETIDFNAQFIETPKELIEDQIKEKLIDNIRTKQDNLEDNEEDDNDGYEVLPYDVKKIKIRKENWSVASIVQYIKDGDIDLSPDFQREFVWKPIQKARLIESLMVGIPIPAFYLSENEEGKYHVVDGRQRLSTIYSFFNNDFSLKYLEYLKEFNGAYYKAEDKKTGIDDYYLKRIEKSQINVNIIDNSAPRSLKYDVFKRINTGGNALNKQEIRNCIANTKTRNMINKLANSKEFKLATNYSINTVRMQAQEFVMRFIGFYLQEKMNLTDIKYTGRMQRFLDELTDQLNEYKGKYDSNIIFAFNNAMLNAAYLFGDYAFRKCSTESIALKTKLPINRALFTTWSILLSDISHETLRETVKENSWTEILANEIQNDTEYHDSISYKTNDVKSLNIAFEKGRKLINK